MKRLDSILLRIFLYGLPLVAAIAAFTYFYNTGAAKYSGGYMEALNAFGGLVLAVWMMLSVYLSVRLIVSGRFRDQVIARITFMRERDEREAMLTGRATKTAFLTSLALLIFLFFLSCFQVSFYRVPPEKAVNGKTGVVSLGFGFCLLEQGKQGQSVDTVQKGDIFSYRGLPISGTAIILVLIVWQIISYNYSMWRQMK